MLKVYQATDVGRVRLGNEDSALVFEPATYVVADGMGGEAAGEVASHLLVSTVREQLEDVYAYGSFSTQSLVDAVQAANQAILQCVSENPAYQGMGTTATILHIDEKESQAYWAHVGDSRLYVLRAGEEQLTQVTRDHSYVEQLVEQGTITEDEAKHHPKRNLLVRAVGVVPELEVDCGSFRLQAGDVMLLATDGLTKHVEDDVIAEVLRRNLQNPARELIDLALSAGGTDNITTIVVVCGA